MDDLLRLARVQVTIQHAEHGSRRALRVELRPRGEVTLDQGKEFLDGPEVTSEGVVWPPSIIVDAPHQSRQLRAEMHHGGERQPITQCVKDGTERGIAPRPRNSSSTMSVVRVREMKVQGLDATAIAKALGIGRASVYRFLEASQGRSLCGENERHLCVSGLQHSRVFVLLVTFRPTECPDRPRDVAPA